MNYKIYIIETIKYILRSPFFIRKELKEVGRLYNMTDNERMEYENQAFLRTFRTAIRKSPFYKKLYSEAGIKESDIQSIKDIKKLPIITKSQIRNCSETLLTRSKKGLKLSHTSGTTGEPLKIYDDWKVHKYYSSYHYVYYKQLGFIFGKDHHVSIRGFLQKKDIKLKLHIANTLFLSSYNIRKETAKLYYTEITKYAPKAISGYPSSLYNLAILFKELNLKLTIPLCFTSSETLHDYQRELISEIFGCEIYDIYGSSEHACTLYESKNHNGYFKAPGSGHLEFNPNGIIATSFINEAWPLIRYQMNDMMEPSNTDVYSFNQPIIVKSLYGRTSECIILNDGTRMGAAGISFIFKYSNNIKIAQLIQYEDRTVDINIVPDKDFSEQDIQNIKKPVYERLGFKDNEFSINLIKQEQIIYSNKNKFSMIISKFQK